MSNESSALHTAYRPRNLKEVVGQSKSIRALKEVIRDKGSQAFLFFGPSGCGKTTLARITAHELGISNIMEIDAATNTGVDDMRKLQASLDYKGFGVNGKARGLLIDECHRISRQAWDSLLKSVEEPPPHITWFFCTTEPHRVPNTIRTRCSAIEVESVGPKDLRKLLDEICGLEKIKLKPGVMDAMIQSANGSPRQALVNLALAKGCADKREAAETLRSVIESEPKVKLAQFLLTGGGSWEQAVEFVRQIGDENPESVRIFMCNYIAGSLGLKITEEDEVGTTKKKTVTSDKKAINCLNILEAFSQPYNPSERQAPLLLSIGRVLFNGPGAEEE